MYNKKKRNFQDGKPMKMKRITALLLATAMLNSLSSCGGKPKTPKSAKEQSSSASSGNPDSGNPETSGEENSEQELLSLEENKLPPAGESCM